MTHSSAIARILAHFASPSAKRFASSSSRPLSSEPYLNPSSRASATSASALERRFATTSRVVSFDDKTVDSSCDSSSREPPARSANRRVASAFAASAAAVWPAVPGARGLFVRAHRRARVAERLLVAPELGIRVGAVQQQGQLAVQTRGRRRVRFEIAQRLLVTLFAKQSFRARKRSLAVVVVAAVASFRVVSRRFACARRVSVTRVNSLADPSQRAERVAVARRLPARVSVGVPRPVQGTRRLERLAHSEPSLRRVRRPGRTRRHAPLRVRQGFPGAPELEQRFRAVPERERRGRGRRGRRFERLSVRSHGGFEIARGVRGVAREAQPLARARDVVVDGRDVLDLNHGSRRARGSAPRGVTRPCKRVKVSTSPHPMGGETTPRTVI